MNVFNTLKYDFKMLRIGKIFFVIKIELSNFRNIANCCHSFSTEINFLAGAFLMTFSFLLS